MMFNSDLIIIPIAAALITLVSIPFVRYLSIRIGAVDKPKSARKIHKFNVPYGGLAVFIGFFVAVLLIGDFSKETIGLLVGCLILVIVGVLDDLYDISSAHRLLGQFIAALVVVSVGIRVDVIGNFGSGNDGLFSLGALSIPFTILWLVGITNAIRLLDGLDGLASGVTGIAAWTLGAVALMTGRYDAAILSFSLGAVAFAFLPNNFTDNKSKKLFLGDVGSNFLGFAIATVSIIGAVKTTAVFSMIIPIIVLTVPIFDTLFAIFRRIMAGKNPFQADRLHLHHRIMDKGAGHKKTTFIIYGITLYLSVLSIMLAGQNGKTTVLIFVLTLAAFIFILFKMGIIKTTEVIKKRR